MTLHKPGPLKECANNLQTEYEESDFCLDGRFNSEEDASLSLKHYHRDRSPTWSVLFDSIFPYQSKPDH